ncbi:MAG: acetyl-CoA carboxylase biotin carboxyl carrier protein [Bacteroidia bacterium]|nr:acetyl-CoA carboxylase biotin carboxyl carrier protein [Bacteroidia bacterium]MCX7651923.1 acetyl-CoA carboxylase biotin carboxyl carrier protein [Bacteroidia bacterium]MDW8416074.1 acetyl-CoA carboxylase biotin carboxyl carrier protein [Bacteroidia bacterium]
MDLKSILELLRFVSKSDLSEVVVEEGDFRLTVRKGTSGNVVSPVSVPPPSVQPLPTITPIAPPPSTIEPPKAEPVPPASPKKLNYIRSPMVGTFYRRPSPDKEPYVKVGDIIQPGQVVCIIEAMKLFNEIQSEIAGRIVRLLVEDGQPVEYDQPLFEVEPIE